MKPAKPLDQAELAATYDAYYQPIYRYIYRFVGDVETTRDLTAEVFHRLLKVNFGKQGPPKTPRPWLYRTAHNLVVDHHRRQQHRNHLPLQETLIDGGDNPARQTEAALAAATVRAALQRLTPAQQQVIGLKFLQGCSNDEVATILDKPVGAVKSLQHRALAALQRCLAGDEEKVTS